MGKHVGDPTADSKSFRDRDAYVRLCENLKRREENISGDGPGRFYFIHLRRHDQRIVGYAEIYKHPIAKERLEIGYAILPNYQQQGFATEAARVLSDAFVRGLESPLHAHINLKNERSAHVLMKAGFREAGPSICRTNNGNAFVQRHFMKTPNPSGQPALTP
jgi:RimJ/RimL family protein N-acetyltransferase